MSSPTVPQTWLITGASSGFGLALSLHALRAGHSVIATVRKRTGGRYADAVKAIEDAGGKCVELDVSDLDAIPKVVEGVLDGGKGKVDVLVNNAGYSLFGGVEDTSVEEAKAQMETNFFGPLRLIQAVIPHMRARKSGTIVNFSSAAGLSARPACGLYSASKFALEGLSESLSGELAPFNISVLIVEPGAFRTNFASAGVRTQKPLDEAYAAPGSPLVQFLDRVKQYGGGRAPGDAEKGAQVVFEVVVGNAAGDGEKGKVGELKGRLLRLPLGSDMVKVMGMKIESLQGDLERAREVAVGTDAEGAKDLM